MICLILVNGNSGIHRSMDRLDVNSCSSSTDSHDTVDEEKRLIQEKLSQLRAPQVGSHLCAYPLITHGVHAYL